MAKQAYKASGKAGDGAFPVLFIATLVTGAALGALEGFISQWISLLLLFPILIGAGVGIAGTLLVEQRLIRAPVLAFVAGALGGGIGQGAVHVVQWRTAVSGVEGAEDVGLVDYLNAVAEQGVEIKRSGRSSGTMKDEWFWVLFAGEFLIAMGVGGTITAGRAREPFCEHCLKWYGEEEVIGLADGTRHKQTLALIDGGEIARAIAEGGAANDKANLVLLARRCTQCTEASPQLIAQRVAKPNSKKPATSVAYKKMISTDELNQLKAAYEHSLS